jgi:hypothetical protein
MLFRKHGNILDILKSLRHLFGGIAKCRQERFEVRPIHSSETGPESSFSMSNPMCVPSS